LHIEFLKSEHLKKIDPVTSKSELSIISGPIRQAEKAGTLLGFSLFSDNEIIVIGGIYRMWEGVGEAFSVMSKNAYKYPKALFSAFARNIETGITAGKYRRLQATVKADFGAGIRFLERLGFEREGLMRSWGLDGSDYYMYARIV
jgi:hypothetical protein